MNILVLCTGNSARSILLESILNRNGQGRITAYSAGSHPTGRVHPGAITLLSARGYDTDHLASKSWDVFAAPDAPVMDIVITVCAAAAGETCPYWPGAPVRAHWGVDDPAAAAPQDIETAFETTYGILERRAQALIEQPFETFDTPTLKALLNRIGEAN